MATHKYFSRRVLNVRCIWHRLQVLCLLSFRWRDEKHYFLVSNRRRVVNHGQKKEIVFFAWKKNTISGWNSVFFSPMSQKNTFFFVNFYLYIGDFEVFPKKSVFWSYLSVGLIQTKSIPKTVKIPSPGDSLKSPTSFWVSRRPGVTDQKGNCELLNCERAPRCLGSVLAN